MCQYNKITTSFEKLEDLAFLTPGKEPAGSTVAVSFTAASSNKYHASSFHDSCYFVQSYSPNILACLSDAHLEYKNI